MVNWRWFNRGRDVVVSRAGKPRATPPPPAPPRSRPALPARRQLQPRPAPSSPARWRVRGEPCRSAAAAEASRLSHLMGQSRGRTILVAGWVSRYLGTLVSRPSLLFACMASPYKAETVRKPRQLLCAPPGNPRNGNAIRGGWRADARDLRRLHTMIGAGLLHDTGAAGEGCEAGL